MKTGTPMGIERSPASERRRRKKLEREEAHWAARSGPVTTRTLASPPSGEVEKQEDPSASGTGPRQAV